MPATQKAWEEIPGGAAGAWPQHKKNEWKKALKKMMELIVFYTIWTHFYAIQTYFFTIKKTYVLSDHTFMPSEHTLYDVNILLT
jgi:hypothetical protein